MERGLHGPEVRRGEDVRRAARAGPGHDGELRAETAARSAARHEVGVQDVGDEPRRRARDGGDGKAAGRLPVGEDLAAVRHGARRRVDARRRRARAGRVLPGDDAPRPRPVRAVHPRRRAGSAARPIVPDTWLPEATRDQVGTGGGGSGYGYQWWARDDGTFEGRGIYGQTLHIDPKRRLVIAINSAAERPTDRSRAAG